MFIYRICPWIHRINRELIDFGSVWICVSSVFGVKHANPLFCVQFQMEASISISMIQCQVEIGNAMR